MDLNDSENVKIVICTTGKKKSFENLIKKLSKFTNVELRINENAFEDFKYLINADYLILRPHNIYGPRMGYSHVIPELITKMIYEKRTLTDVNL